MPLDEGWVAASAAPDSFADPAELDGLTWLPARVPGTVASVLAEAGLMAADLDAQDWWFRTNFQAARGDDDESVVLFLDGLATIAEVYLNGEQVVVSDSMFVRHAIEIGGRLRGANELAIRFSALGPRLSAPRRPRARWRTRLVADGNLRWIRTTLLGRAPGFAPGPPAVGPWGPVWLERRRGITVERIDLRPRLDGDEGVLSVRLGVRTIGARRTRQVGVVLTGETGSHHAYLDTSGDEQRLLFRGEVRVPAARRWWPHTHGEPALYDVRFKVETDVGPIAIDAGRVGFRRLAAGPGAGHDLERDGLDLHLNDVRIFARGAVWTPVDPRGLAPSPGSLRAAVETARDGGMNMLRLPGTGAYEQDAFYDLCDELGVLVWQDLMFANMDYPFADDAFRALAEAEATDVIDRLAGRPSFAVLCGNSEIEQQIAMLGLDPTFGRADFFGVTIPALSRASGADAVYAPSAPFGGDQPFRPDRGVANYYGVGGYRRPLADARSSGVRFAAECLAFANVPDEAVVESLLPDSAAGVVVHHPRWKAGVPRDVGSGWDFDDVRDHYLADLFGQDPGELRRIDHERYLEFSRAVSGEVMAEVFGEWRRTDSTCHGALVLWLRDLAAGAGWGVLDHRGMPKVAYHHLRRALAPVAVWTTDEGLGGVVVHVANDHSTPLVARLRVALYRDLEQPVGEGQETIDVAAHGAHVRNVETLLGHFVDVSWAYRFGPPAHDVLVVSLEQDGQTGRELLSQAVRFPAGRPVDVERPDRLALEASAQSAADGTVRLTVRSRRLAYGVRIHVDGFSAGDDAFSVEPGGTRLISLHPLDDGRRFGGGTLTALNLIGQIPIEVVGGPP
ncbi:MAG: glycoside hydrolase family 2 protein [Chloroflexi bacterium]|nr:glycoside hydrolase family 2 protein [Chloroflexota bacterium]